MIERFYTDSFLIYKFNNTNKPRKSRKLYKELDRRHITQKTNISYNFLIDIFNYDWFLTKLNSNQMYYDRYKKELSVDVMYDLLKNNNSFALHDKEFKKLFIKAINSDNKKESYKNAEYILECVKHGINLKTISYYSQIPRLIERYFSYSKRSFEFFCKFVSGYNVYNFSDTFICELLIESLDSEYDVKYANFIYHKFKHKLNNDFITPILKQKQKGK